MEFYLHVIHLNDRLTSAYRHLQTTSDTENGHKCRHCLEEGVFCLQNIGLNLRSDSDILSLRIASCPVHENEEYNVYRILEG